MRELFVWYRVAAGRADTLRPAVESMQRSLATTWPGLQARLLIRRDHEGQTWMETYAIASPGDGRGRGIDAAIEAAIATAARPWAGLVDGERHVEAFEAASAAAVPG